MGAGGICGTWRSCGMGHSATYNQVFSVAGPLKSATKMEAPSVFVEIIMISTTEGVVLVEVKLSLGDHYLEV